MPRSRFRPRPAPQWHATQSRTGQWFVAGPDGSEAVRSGSEAERARVAQLQAAAPLLEASLEAALEWLIRVSVQGTWVDPALIAHCALAIKLSKLPLDHPSQTSGKEGQIETTFDAA